MEPENLEEGDKVLFNDRKTPLEVVKTGEETMVQGPQGADYMIYTDNDALLVARKGNRRYASYCKNLRTVGEWERKTDFWEHSKTGAKARIRKKENGFWTVETEGIENSMDAPMYGFTKKEFAEEEVEKFIQKNPEG